MKQLALTLSETFLSCTAIKENEKMILDLHPELD